MVSCLLDPPCTSCAFGSNVPKTAVIRILISKTTYGCNKGGGDVVETAQGVGLETRSGIRYLTEAGKARALEMDHPNLVV